MERTTTTTTTTKAITRSWRKCLLQFLFSYFLLSGLLLDVNRIFSVRLIILEPKEERHSTFFLEKESALHTTPTTAVVVAAKYLTNCTAARLHHLVATTPRHIDVWFLHDHANYLSNSTEVTTSEHHLQWLKRSFTNRFYDAPKDVRHPIGMFDTARSGAAKSSFLRWMTNHSLEYQYAWHIEEDVFYTGLWSEVFLSHEQDTADLVATRLRCGRSWIWNQDNTCRIQYEQRNETTETSTPRVLHYSNSTTSAADCNTVVRVAHHWAITRLSQTFARHLLDDLESKRVFGHHEAVMDILLQVHDYNLTFNHLQKVARVEAPESDSNYPTLETFATSGIILPQRLYHPIKCKAYFNDSAALLKHLVYHGNYSVPKNHSTFIAATDQQHLTAPLVPKNDSTTLAATDQQHLTAPLAKEPTVGIEEKEAALSLNRTAVVVFANHLTYCGAIRLHHLLATTPPEMDVWLLHEDDEQDGHDPGNQSSSSQSKLVGHEADSLTQIQSLMQKFNNNAQEQRQRFQHASKDTNRPIPIFDTPDTGAAKSSFLRWMKRHQDQYDYAWHVEEDAFYTGLWSDLFRFYENNTADLVTKRMQIGRSWVWTQKDACRIQYKQQQQKNDPTAATTRSTLQTSTSTFSPECNKVVRNAHHWATVRMSQSFANHLLEDLERESLYGHHQAIVDVLLQVPTYNLTYAELSPHVGKLTSSVLKSNNSITLEILAQPDVVLSNRLYYPIKCKAYNETKLTKLLKHMVFDTTNATNHSQRLELS